jgi:hypothetical protein
MTRTNQSSVWKSITWGIVTLAAILLLNADRLVVAEAGARPVAAKQRKAEKEKEENAAPGEADANAYPARSAQVPTTDPVAMLQRGGPVMWVLAFCSVVGLAFVFERMVALRKSRVIPKSFVTRFLQQVREGDLDRERAMAVCQGNPSPVAMVFGGAVRKWGRPAVEVEQAIIYSGERATYDLRRYLRVFTALAVMTPFTRFRSRESSLLAAPRILNDPVFCRFSSLERTFPPNRRDSGASSTSGGAYASR